MDRSVITVGEVLESFDALSENDIPDSVKIGWIAELDGKLRCEVLCTPIDEIVAVTGEDDELCAPRVYARVYTLYLAAMTELYGGKEDAYNTVMREYDRAYGEYAKFCLRQRA